jgi:hypothetical protein
MVVYFLRPGFEVIRTDDDRRFPGFVKAIRFFLGIRRLRDEIRHGIMNRHDKLLCMHEHGGEEFKLKLKSLRPQMWTQVPKRRLSGWSMLKRVQIQIGLYNLEPIIVYWREHLILVPIYLQNSSNCNNYSVANGLLCNAGNGYSALLHSFAAGRFTPKHLIRANHVQPSDASEPKQYIGNYVFSMAFVI